MSYRDERRVTVTPEGIREVLTWSEYGESWSGYIIVPRELVNQEIRKLRAGGQRPSVMYWWEYMPKYARERIMPEGCGGPGQPFARKPWYRATRRWVVMYQSGGLDV